MPSKLIVVEAESERESETRSVGRATPSRPVGGARRDSLACLSRSLSLFQHHNACVSHFFIHYHSCCVFYVVVANGLENQQQLSKRIETDDE